MYTTQEIRMENQTTVSNIFWKFLKIGSFSFGGVYSMLSFFERELVDKEKWLTNDEFVESVAIGQMTPGPPIVNTGICIGYKLNKIKGALATTIGQSFTGTTIAIMLAVFYVKSEGNAALISVMKGVGAAVVGLLLSTIFRMSKNTIKDVKAALFALIAFAALALGKVNPIGVILASGIFGLLIYGRGAK